MTSTEAGLLADICAHPADMELRSIYADWLEERGDPRGEFIRVQIKLGNCKHKTCYVRDANSNPVMPETTCETCGLGSPMRRRERELLETHGRGWLKSSLGRPLDKIDLAGTFRRGFVELVRLSAADCLQHLDALRKVCPIREVELTSELTLTDIEFFQQQTSRDGMGPTFTEVKFRGREAASTTKYPEFRRNEGGQLVLDPLVMMGICWPGIRFLPPPPVKVDNFVNITGQMVYDAITAQYAD